MKERREGADLGDVREELLEVRAIAQRLEVRVLGHPVRVGVAGRQGLPEHLHGLVGVQAGQHVAAGGVVERIVAAKLRHNGGEEEVALARLDVVLGLELTVRQVGLGVVAGLEGRMRCNGASRVRTPWGTSASLMRASSSALKRFASRSPSSRYFEASPASSSSWVATRGQKGLPGFFPAKGAPGPAGVEKGGKEEGDERRTFRLVEEGLVDLALGVEDVEVDGGKHLRVQGATLLREQPGVALGGGRK